MGIDAAADFAVRLTFFDDRTQMVEPGKEDTLSRNCLPSWRGNILPAQQQ